MEQASFQDLFGFPPEASASAPGRVNLLGEHTDYNDGFVLPTAIPQQTLVEMGRSSNGVNRFHAADLGESASSSPGGPVPNGFAAYLHGCLSLLADERFAVQPVCVRVTSDVPIGAGLSSSAALEVAVLRAARALFRLDFDDVKLALMAQQAEIRFAGVNCGIMDQMASSLADSRHMLFLDTRSLDRRLLPLPAGAELLVIDSGVKRKLEESSYNLRRHECEQAARLLGVKALRDIEDVGSLVDLPPVLARRARHVVTENTRVLAASSGVDAQRFGELMNASHESLRDDYAVSIPALDCLVELLQCHGDVYGARLTGAGFGGACVALVKDGSAGPVAEQIMESYRRQGYHGRKLVPI